MPTRCDFMMPEQTVWNVGGWQHAEFSEAVAWLKSRAACLLFDDAGTADSNLRTVEAANAPIAMVLVQSRPGQISRGSVERLHAAAPLARLVALVGTWCDGELRSGRPWPGVVRVPINS